MRLRISIAPSNLLSKLTEPGGLDVRIAPCRLLRAMRVSTQVIVAAVFIAPLGGCEAETRIVRMRGIGHDFPGAQAGWMKDAAANNAREADAKGKPAREEVASKDLKPVDPAAREEADPLRIVKEDGSVRLVSKSPRHVVYHLRQTLIAGETDLLFEQVLSEQTKREYLERRLDPQDAVKFLLDNRRDVLRLLARMPMGEATPGMFLKKVGHNTYRLEVTSGVGELKFRKVDFVWEPTGVRLALIS